MDALHGRTVLLRPATPDDAPAFRAALDREEVAQWWDGWPSMQEDLTASEGEHLAIVTNGEVIGMIQWWEVDSPACRHSGIDMFLHPDHHRRGYGTDALNTIITWLLGPRGHHRVTIDPATDNTPAIACYEKAGFQRVGVLRQYWKDRDGTWRDGLLLDLVAGDLATATGNGRVDG